jgi:hypothetical protein
VTGRNGTAVAPTLPPADPWALAEVPARRLFEDALEVRFSLGLGDRAMVEAGSTVAAGDPLLERLRDRRIDEVTTAAPADEAVDAHPAPRAGRRWTPRSAGGRMRRETGREGELLAPVPSQRDRWRIVTGEHRDVVHAPIDGEVLEVVPGSEIRVRAAGHALRGAFAAGSPSRGRLELATDPFGELRAGGIDVGRAGSVLVVGARIDAEALTRARAMGVRGIVVASLPGKDLRDFRASERRQRAALHAAPPFAVLVLEGTVRRRMPTPVAGLLERLEGRDVAIVTDPPALLFPAGADEIPPADPGWVRVRSGPDAGAEGQLVGSAGLRRFARGVQLEAAFVALDGGQPVAIPLGDLERLG